jgi:peptidoglycan/xylan/chitin deacetylase (PgdA/CDA1 family)
MTNVWDSGDGVTSLPLLDAAGLRRVAAQGIEVGAHTTTHPQLPEVPSHKLDDELAGAAARLEELGLPRPRAFSYPFGLWDEGLAQAVRDAGYEVAFTMDRGVVRPGSDPHSLPRLAVHSSDTGRGLHLKMATAHWPGPVRGALRRLAKLRPRA